MLVTLRNVGAAFVFAAAAAMAGACGGVARADGAGDAARADAALDRALARLVALPGGPPGVIAIVQRGATPVVHSFGVGDTATGAPPRSNQHMRVASVAKAFSGAAALALVDRGILSLDDTIGRRVPFLPRSWWPITLRQLLGHTSGLPDFSQTKTFRDALLADLTDALPPRELLKFVANRKPTTPPGSTYRYSNTDNIVVALMVRAVLETSYNHALAARVYRPLRLRQTSLPGGPKIPSPFIHGYGVDPSEPPEDVTTVIAAGWAWASGGIVSTPADLNRFIRGYVGGELFEGRVRAAQRRVVVGGASEPPGPGANSAGLALFRYETRCGTMWGHTGNTLGYTQFAAASDDGRRSVTVSINAQLTPDVGAPGVFEALRAAEELAVCAAFAR